jgi:hypothetical protein
MRIIRVEGQTYVLIFMYVIISVLCYTYHISWGHTMAERKPRTEPTKRRESEPANKSVFNLEILVAIITIIGIFAASASLIISFRNESREDWNRSREDWARTEQKIEVMRQEAKEFREMWAKESKEFNEKWAKESKEFHGRLIEIEQSRKN